MKSFKVAAFYTLSLTLLARVGWAGDANGDSLVDLSKLTSPILLRGDEKTAFRDPAVVYHDGVFYVFTTYIRTEGADNVYLYTAVSTSRNLTDWSSPRILTPKGQQLNYSSPGNMVRFRGEWLICLQSYPIPGLTREGPLRWANQDARIFIMRSRNLLDWSPPELLRVKGPDVPPQEMGRMIDPYLIEDKDELGKWWCFFKQRGFSYSWSCDLKHWTYHGNASGGENVCVLVEDNEYVLFHSPGNGIGIKRSTDFEHWRDWDELIILGQRNWPWAETRLTAGVVLDLRREPAVGRYLMFFHGVGPGRTRTMDNAFANCSIGIAWSDDLRRWDWPGKK